MRKYENELWIFETARYFVGLYAEPESDAPEGMVDNPAVVRAIREGDLAWFVAVVRVFRKEDWRELGSSALGGCAYEHASDFRHSGYVPQMEAEAIADARVALAS